ncbi:MAG: DUF2889 domain-containing protein [Acidimicrobiales bacterium]
MSLPEPTGTLIHDRTYDVAAYREGPDRLRLRGKVHDQKSPGIYIEDDPDPLSVHQMEVDLLLDFPAMTILEVAVEMQTTPHRGCTAIEPDYQQLVGMSIARGFARKVKDTLGGPKGCTHIGALLQAMAPVAIQSSWSMRSLAVREDPSAVPVSFTADDRMRAMAFNLNTCHIWDEEGEQVANVKAGVEMEIPVWAEDRLAALGRTPEEWRKF